MCQHPGTHRLGDPVRHDEARDQSGDERLRHPPPLEKPHDHAVQHPERQPVQEQGSQAHRGRADAEEQQRRFSAGEQRQHGADPPRQRHGRDDADPHELGRHVPRHLRGDQPRLHPRREGGLREQCRGERLAEEIHGAVRADPCTRAPDAEDQRMLPGGDQPGRLREGVGAHVPVWRYHARSCNQLGGAASGYRTSPASRTAAPS